MSKSPEHNTNYGMRREMRLRRSKTAMALMPWFLARAEKEATEGMGNGDVKLAAARAVNAADILLAELDRTAKHES